MSFRDVATWLAALAMTVVVAAGAAWAASSAVGELQRCWAAVDTMACLTGGGQ